MARLRTRLLKRWLAWGLAGAILAGAGGAWAIGSMLTQGRPSAVPAAIAPARDLTIPSSDGITLGATYRPGARPGAPAVLILHGLGGSRATGNANAEWLAGQGYAVLTIDFRGHGTSTPSRYSYGYREAADARAAFDWLKRQQGGAPVAIIGISLGGAASLLGEAGPVPADALILQAVYPNVRDAIRNRLSARLPWLLAAAAEPVLSFQSLPRFGAWPSDLSPETAIAAYRGPVLVIGGEEDASTPPAETRRLHDAATGRRDLWLVAQGDHATICSLTDADYRARVLGFLTRTIGRP